MLRAAPFAVLAMLAAPAGAQTLRGAIEEGEFFADTRVRVERFEDDAKPDPAEAASARVRVGFLTGEFRRLSALIEAEGTAVEGDLAAPGSAEPHPSIGVAGNVELNRLQVMYETDGVYASAGRQLLEFGDERYVGDEDWRQDDRTFDALYGVLDIAQGLEASYAYAWRMNDTYRDEYAVADAHLGQLQYIKSNALRLSAYAYLIDLPRLPMLSSATYGLRANGSLPAWMFVLDYDVSWARQMDYGSAAGEFELDDISAAGTLAYGPLSATARYQRLEGNGVRGVTYPFATRHGQRGWTDLFEQGPATGLEVKTLAAEANLSSLVASVRGLVLEGAFHDFSALDPLPGGREALGKEWNAGARLTLDRNWSAGLGFTDFTGAKGGAIAGPADQQRVWFELNWRR